MELATSGELSHSKEHTCPRLTVAIPSVAYPTSSSIINAQLGVSRLLFNHCRGNTAPNQKLSSVIKIISCALMQLYALNSGVSSRYAEKLKPRDCVVPDKVM